MQIKQMFLTFSCSRTRAKKNFQQFSLESTMPRPWTSLRIPEIILSTSSSLNRSGISPAPKGMSRIIKRLPQFKFYTWLEMLYNTKFTFKEFETETQFFFLHLQDTQHTEDKLWRIHPLKLAHVITFTSLKASPRHLTSASRLRKNILQIS